VADSFRWSNPATFFRFIEFCLVSTEEIQLQIDGGCRPVIQNGAKESSLLEKAPKTGRMVECLLRWWARLGKNFDI
jgi:hypothetical protein